MEKTGSAAAAQVMTAAEMIGWVMVGLVVLAVSVWLVYAWKVGRWRWIQQTHTRYRNHSFAAAIVLGACFTLFALAVAWWMTTHVRAQTEALISSPGGVVAALLGAIVTVWTLITTLAVRTHQEQRIADVPSLLKRANDVFEELEIANAKQKDLNREATEIYVMDYDPGIGIHSAPKEHERFGEYLKVAAGTKLCSVHAVFATQSDVDDFHRILKTPQALLGTINAVMKRIVDAEWSFVYRSADVGALHIIIIGDVAFQYIILPTPGEKSRTVGIETHDVQLVEFLRETVQSSIRKAVTPALTVTATDVTFSFQQHPNVTRVNVAAVYDDGAKPSPNAFIEKDWPWPANGVLTLTRAELPEATAFRCTLYKDQQPSKPSNIVHLP